MKKKIKQFFKSAKNIKDLMLIIAFIIAFINTLFINVHVAFYMMSIFIVIAAIF
jgi:hypothetical protein